MAKPKSGLGHGLDSLVSNSIGGSNSDRLTTVAVEDMQPGRCQAQVQVDNEALQELAGSIRAQGVIQPVIMREHGLSQHELIVRERRWHASQLAGLTKIPVVVRSISDETALTMGLIENLQRENLNPIKETQGLRRLADEFGLTHETIAKAVGRGRSTISNTLCLLSLPEPMQDMLCQRHLEMGHARALLTLPAVEQLRLTQKAAKNGWSVREVERRSQATQQTVRKDVKKTINTDIRRLNDALTEKLGVNVKVRITNHKKGKITLHFDTPRTFEYLLKQLGVEYEAWSTAGTLQYNTGHPKIFRRPVLKK